MKKIVLFLILFALIPIGIFAQVYVPVTNNSFSDPPYTGKINNGLGIPGWKWDGTATDAGRENKKLGMPGDSLFAYVYNKDPMMYQVLNEKIGTTVVKYKLSYYSKQDYVVSNSSVMRTYFGAKNGGAITLIDSTDNALTPGQWKGPFKYYYLIQANSANAGDSLVIAFRLVTSDGDKGWADIDSVKVKKISPLPTAADSVHVTFSNTNDSLEVLHSGTVMADVYPDGIDQNVTWEFANTEIATLSSNGITSVDSLKTGKVTITATSVADVTKKGSIEITIYRVIPTEVSIDGTDSVDRGAAIFLTPKFVPSNTTYRDKVVWSSSDTAIAKIDSLGKVTGIRKGTATITVKDKYSTVVGTKTIKVTYYNGHINLEVINPSFELPIEGNKIKLFYGGSITGWNCDDPRDDETGREAYGAGDIGPGGGGKTHAYTTSDSKPVYQAIDIVGTDSIKYLVSYYANNGWTPGGDSLYALFYLSHYTPGGTQTPRDRQYIDSLRLPLTGTMLLNATFRIPEGTIPAGDSVIVELSARSYTISTHLINMSSRYSWMNFDQVSVTKLSAVVPATSIELAFETPGDAIRVGSTGTMSATFKPEGNTYSGVKWSVSNTSIATIDASGNLLGIAKGVVTVTASSDEEPGLKATKDISITGGVGVKSLLSENTRVYPNPSDGNFIVKAPGGSDVSITDATGHVIYKVKTVNDKTNFSLPNKGLYLIQIKSGSGVMSNKIIVR